MSCCYLPILRVLEDLRIATSGQRSDGWVGRRSWMIDHHIYPKLRVRAEDVEVGLEAVFTMHALLDMYCRTSSAEESCKLSEEKVMA